MRPFLGNAEGRCIRQCFVRAIGWAQRNTFDPQMSFVFDNRPSSVQRDARIVFDTFHSSVKTPALTAIDFLSSFDVRPLQAADLIAWELYQYANDVLAKGVEIHPRRQQLQRLVDGIAFQAEIVDKPSVQRIVRHWLEEDPAVREELIRHFTFFDPYNPAY
jgi:hypothetical protein